MELKELKNVHILKHPLIDHKIALIRDKNTNTKQFREIISDLISISINVSIIKAYFGLNE